MVTLLYRLADGLLLLKCYDKKWSSYRVVPLQGHLYVAGQQKKKKYVLDKTERKQTNKSRKDKKTFFAETFQG